MRAERVDERDSNWEDDRPRFRLYTFEGAANAVETIDLWDCTVEEALEEAEATAGDRLWSLALVHGTGSTRGLVWLSGNDYNGIDLESPTAVRLRAAMQDRYLSARAQRDEPVVLPDGRAVIRMFPEWGLSGPLWRSFTDDYPADPAQLGLSTELIADLEAWNDAWADRHSEVNLPEPADLPDTAEWLEEGWRLFALVQKELRDTAEIRPDFAL